MNATYRGHRITVRRARALVGYDLTYYTVVRLADGAVVEDAFTDSAESEREVLANLKRRVDNEVALAREPEPQ